MALLGIRDRIDQRGAALGAWLSLREPLAAEAASRAGFDYVCVDVQHGLQSYDVVVAMLTSIATGDALPIVRVPWNEPAFIGRVLDAGALGVIVPMVNDLAEAEAAVAAAKYPPLGARSLGPTVAAARYGRDYLDGADDLVAVIPMIETATAVANVADIAAVAGVAGLYVGPADLSLSLGLRPALDQDDARFDDALAATVAACKRSGIIAGIHTSAELVPKRREQGFELMTVGYDFAPLVAGLHRSLREAGEHLTSR